MKAAFAEIDITPPPGTAKIGWLKSIVPTRVHDPLFARVAILESRGRRLGFVALDTLFVRAEETAAIRLGVEHRHGFPSGCVMVSATHNHGGPAVAECGDVRVDDAYCRALVERCVTAFGEALGRMAEAQLALGAKALFGVGHNRRIIQRSGVVKTHATFDDPESLCFEGPVDPELAVLALRQRTGEWLGAIVNFANHPTDHGGDDAFSAGWPGVLARELKAKGCPAVFLNGAYGNIASPDPMRGGKSLSMEETGATLAAHVLEVLNSLIKRPQDFRNEVALECSSRMVRLPYRDPTPEQIRGTVRGAQRFIDPAIYERNIPRVLEEIRSNAGQLPAEVQVASLDDLAFAAFPCELFVEHGLRIKERAHPRRALMVGSANGIVGYVPHAAAFERGGYETTFLGTSKLAPHAGDLLVTAALELIAETRPK